MEEFNPYEPPKSSDRLPNSDVWIGLPRNAIHRMWFRVFVLNTALPFVGGMSMTNANARVGMAIAVAALFTAGFLISTFFRKPGDCLIVGGYAVGLAQLFPILQISAGMAGMLIGKALGMVDVGVDLDDASTAAVRSPLGGFVITLITGTLLMTFSLISGFLIQGIRKRWRRRPETATES